MAAFEVTTYFSRYKRYYEVLSKAAPLFATDKARAYTIFTLSLFALSFFGFFAINPTLTTIAQLRKQVEDAQNVERLLQQKITNLILLQKAYPSIENDIPIIHDALPKEGRPANLLGKIIALANRTNLTVITLQVQQVPISRPKDVEKPSSFSFFVSGRGTYENISSFLSKIYEFDRIVTIDAFTIAKPTGKVEEQALSFSLKGKAHILFEK